MTKGIVFGNNAFDWIRLLAALQVVSAHALTHLKMDYTIGFFDNILRWFPGVVVLFAISGYLITASMERSAGNMDYVKKRISRIFPGLIVCSFVTLIVILFFVNLNWEEIVLFTGLHTTFFQWFTPEFLRDYGTGAVNGALWTIVVELQFYLFTLLFYKSMKKFSMSKWLLVIGIFLGINIVMPIVEGYIPVVIYGLLLETFIPYIYIYLIGAFLFTFKDTLLPMLMSYFNYIIVTFLGWSLANEFLSINIGEHYDILTGVLLPIIVISFGYKLGERRLPMDLSYGFYLYHMVIINVLVQVGITGTVMSLIITFVLSLIAALLSWNIVEKPFLKRKTKVKENTVLI